MSSSFTLESPAPQLISPGGTAVAWSGALQLRPKWWSIRRPSDLHLRPMAIAAHDALCPGCDVEVLEDEPILCVGAWVVANEDGTRTVDMSGCEWRCQRCVTIYQPGGLR